ncbi:hypothetical protein D3C86_1507380 [compost metagenome]
MGQADWNPLNYSIDAAGIKDAYKYFKTVSSNVEKAGGDENMKFTGAAGIYKVVVNADFGVKSLTVTSTTSVWDIPNLYIVGTVNNWTPESALPFSPLGNGKFEYIGQLANGSAFKFLGQQAWDGLEWGNIHSEGNTGYLGIKGDNNNIKFDGGDNYFKIIVDLKVGKYTITQL